VQRASETHGDFTHLGPAAAALTPYATAFRYPGGAYEPMPSREEFDEAMAHSEFIHDFVLNALPAEARP